MYNYFGPRSMGTAIYDKEIDVKAAADYPTCDAMLTNAKYIPLRLDVEERRSQRMIAAAVSVSDYTDKVDCPQFAEGQGDEEKVKGQRSRQQLKMIGNVLQGLQNAAKETIETEGYSQKYLQEVMEYARRFKIMNPDLMRSEYPKFIYLMQDGLRKELQTELGIDLRHQILTLDRVLAYYKAEAMLEDPMMKIATTPVPPLEPRERLNKALRKKDLVVKELLRKYKRVPDQYLERCIRSIDDANCYVRDNAETVNQMLILLQKYFKAEGPESESLSLSIRKGSGGSRLTHEHTEQFRFVTQSLMLWRNIAKDMFRLWYLVEQDLLSEEAPYRFTDTGQGFNRVQQSPLVFNAMLEIVNQTKQEAGGWVGSDRVHIGDKQVPNGMMFIDKYTQVNRIINPILNILKSIDKDMARPGEGEGDRGGGRAGSSSSSLRRGSSAVMPQVKADRRKGVAEYVERVFGGPEQCKKVILADFFRHGFDGSGGDNMDDAGSCIDGRLTSAWNWCQNIKHKPFYPVFLIAGFSSFDGDF